MATIGKFAGGLVIMAGILFLFIAFIVFDGGIEKLKKTLKNEDVESKTISQQPLPVRPPSLEERISAADQKIIFHGRNAAKMLKTILSSNEFESSLRQLAIDLETIANGPEGVNAIAGQLEEESRQISEKTKSINANIHLSKNDKQELLTILTSQKVAVDKALQQNQKLSTSLRTIQGEHIPLWITTFSQYAIVFGNEEALKRISTRIHATAERLDQQQEVSPANPTDQNISRAPPANQIHFRTGAGMVEQERLPADRVEKRPAQAEHTGLPLTGASRDGPFVNSLGMQFVFVRGTDVLFSIWETRIQDYEAYARNTPQADKSWRNPGFDQAKDHPVVNVSWLDAQAFCAWLTNKERAEGLIGKESFYRLPTDSEWSLAVGLDRESGDAPGEKHMETLGYPWGKRWPPPREAGNYDPSLNVDDFKYTSPVGSFAANQYGLFDLGGNVWEWCEDSFYGDNGPRVVRGGSWRNYNPENLMSSIRSNDGPAYRYGYNGFRCVLVVGSSRSAGGF
jgi:hypothetical protein